MKDKHPIDDYFKKAVEGHSTEPSASVWEKIEAGTESAQRRGAGWYLLRAAIVVIMFGVASWLYFDRQPELNNNMVSSPVEERQDDQAAENQENTNQPNKEGTEKPVKTEEERKREKVMPIMRSPGNNRPIYVNNEALPEVVDEEDYILDDPQSLASVELSPEQIRQYSSPPVKVKLRLSKPVTQEAFYAEADTADQPKDIKQKLYAYANNQWENLISGRPVELPKTKKPQLEINLNKILNN